MNLDKIQEQQAIRDRYRHPIEGWIEFSLAAVEQSIASRFEEQVTSYEDRLAIKSADHEFSYGQLNRLANRIAHAILENKKQATGRQAVGILLDNNAPMVAAILGILKTGRAYVPLDPSFPAERLAYYVNDSGLDLILTDRANRAVAVELMGTEQCVLDIGKLSETLESYNPEIFVEPDAIAYIYYTSGSTGTPKSVYNNQRNLLHHTRRNSNSFCICPEDRLICLKSFSFNGALKELFCTLLNGASLHLYPLKTRGTARLAQWLNENQITIYNSSGTVFRQLVNGITSESRFPHLRMLYIGAERIKASDLDAYREFFGHNTLLALGLGATEAGAITRLYLDSKEEIVGDIVPVGYPVEEVAVLIFDEAGQPLGPNQEGQIAVRSRYLALGYWHNEELTAEKFIAESNEGERIYLTGDMGYFDETGSLYHLGREDFQVKIRGYRVGLEEIETALLKHPQIQEGTVIAKTLHSGEQGLVAYYVLGSTHRHEDSSIVSSPTVSSPTVSSLRHFLANTLPDYMIPSAFVELDNLPTTPYGKLDIKALSSPDRSRPHLYAAYVEPRTPQEEAIGAIWSRVLGIDQIGVQDDFFDLGGQSILMMQLITDLERILDGEISVPAFLEEPTIAALAAYTP